MSRNKRSLTDFGTFETRNSDTEQLNVSEKRNTNTEQSYVTEKRNTENEQENVQALHNNESEQSFETVKSNAETETGFMQQFEERTKKLTIEDTHTRQTYLIRNDLLKRLNKVAKGKDRGFKTQLVNYALEQILNEID